MHDAQALIHHQDAYRSSLPARYRRATLSDLPETRRTALAAWLNDPAAPWALVLTGPPGRGKTHAACALGLEYARCFRSVTFANWPAWIEAKKAAMDGGRHPADLTGDGGRTFDDPQPTGLLVLDDLGAGRMTEYAAGLLYVVVDGREANAAKTIFTTNQRLEDFGAIDGRLGSRLSGAKWLTFAGDDLRPTVRTPVQETIPPPPKTVEEVTAEAARQQLDDFEAATFLEKLKPSDTNWRRYMAPWNKAFNSKLTRFDDATAAIQEV
jgi:hypothetical protein